MSDKLFFKASEAYEKGDYGTAYSLFLKNAEVGDSSSMSRIALMYFDGKGVDRDIEKSILWDKKAIDAGSFASIGNLAINYRESGDLKRAEIWFQKAIEAGDGGAALELAKMYIDQNEEYTKVYETLNIVIESQNVCESSVEEALSLLNDRK